MNNFPIKYEDKTFWISRSVAVAAFIFAKNKDGENCILINKRGPGCPNEVGKWTAPCGYLDYNETLTEAAMREVYEETGVSIPANLFTIVGVNASLYNNQNVTIRFRVMLNDTVENIEKQFSTEHSEPNEVDDIKFVPLSEICNYELGFRHNKVLFDVLNAENAIFETTVKE